MVGLPRRRSVVTELVLKELHLYQLPIAVAVLYAAAVPLVYAYVLSDVFVRGAILGPLTILYVFSIAALTGSLASAQERQLGTLEWQTLLPLAARRQWMVKLAVALLVVLVLAFGVPAGLLMVVQPAGQILGKAEPIVPPAVLLFAGSIYVSSLCTGGVRALAVSLPTLLGVALLLHWIVDWTSSIARHLAATSYFGIDRAHPPYGRIIAWGFLASGVLVIGGAFAEFAYRNHRSSERPWSRVAAQALVLTMIAAVVLAAGFVLGV
jgi:hypothetical protein